MRACSECRWDAVLTIAGFTVDDRLYFEPRALEAAVEMYEESPMYVGHEWYLGASLATALRSTTASPTPNSPPPATSELRPERHLTFAPQSPSAAGETK